MADIHKSKKLVFLPFLILLFGSTANPALFAEDGAAGNQQPLAELKSTARQFLEHHPGLKDYADLGVVIHGIDERLQLPHCNQGLEAFMPPGNGPLGNTTLGIRCTGNTPWSIYVQARVTAYADIPITRRPLPRGQKIEEEDIAPSRLAVNQLPPGYLAAAGQIVGRELRRPVAAGTVLTSAMVALPRLVRRGQQVTLVAGKPGFEVKMRGTAMDDGARGDIIQVRNNSSKSLVEGRVTGSGTVRTGS